MADTPVPITPLEGRTTIDDRLTFEPTRLGYDAARRVASIIASDVAPDVTGRAVVVAGDAFLVDLGNLGTAKLQLDMLAADYRRVAESLAPPPVALERKAFEKVAPTSVLPAVTVGLQSALGLASLLREDVEFHGVPTTIDAKAFEIAIAAALRAAAATTVHVPDLVVVRAPVDAPGSLREKLETMQAARRDAWQAAGPLLAELGPIDAALDAATRNNVPQEVEALSRRVFELRRQVEPLSQTLGQADRRLNELQAQWDKASETTGLTMLSRLLRAEALDAAQPIYLHAAVVASGGHHRVSRNLFRMLFVGDGLSSMGGVVVRWALLDTTGAFGKGGVRTARSSAAFPVPGTSGVD